MKNLKSNYVENHKHLKKNLAFIIDNQFVEFVGLIFNEWLLCKMSGVKN